MSAGTGNSNGNDDDIFNENEDDPYAIITEDKYETPDPNSKPFDTDTQLSKFVEDRWNNETNESVDGDEKSFKPKLEEKQRKTSTTVMMCIIYVYVNVEVT